jgi:hypothetical protein
MSAGARRLIIPSGFLPPEGLGLRAMEVGVEVDDRGGGETCGEGFGRGFDIMDEMMSEGLGLGAAAGGVWRG